MKKRGETLVTFGKYAGETYETAYKDKDYRFWFMGHDGAELVKSRLIDVDGSVSGTGALTLIGGQSIGDDAAFVPEFNAYMSVIGDSNVVFEDSFELP